MTHRIQNFAAALFLSLCAAACSSVEPAAFERSSRLDGSIIESNMLASVQRTSADTYAARLFKTYLEPVPSTVKVQGFFFFQNKGGSGAGTGTGDVVERAAFLALDLPKDQAGTVANNLRECLRKDDFQRADVIYQELAKAAGVQFKNEMDEKTGNPAKYWEYKYGKDGSILPHGIVRTFHPNGMIASECYYRNGKAEGTPKNFNDLGILIGSH